MRKLSDIQTDGQMDDFDFIGCCQTNIQHRKLRLIVTKLSLRGRTLNISLDFIS